MCALLRETSMLICILRFLSSPENAVSSCCSRPPHGSGTWRCLAMMHSVAKCRANRFVEPPRGESAERRGILRDDNTNENGGRKTHTHRTYSDISRQVMTTPVQSARWGVIDWGKLSKNVNKNNAQKTSNVRKMDENGNAKNAKQVIYRVAITAELNQQPKRKHRTGDVNGTNQPTNLGSNNPKSRAHTLTLCKVWKQVSAAKRLCETWKAKRKIYRDVGTVFRRLIVRMWFLAMVRILLIFCSVEKSNK